MSQQTCFKKDYTNNPITIQHHNFVNYFWMHHNKERTCREPFSNYNTWWKFKSLAFYGKKALITREYFHYCFIHPLFLSQINDWLVWKTNIFGVNYFIANQKKQLITCFYDFYPVHLEHLKYIEFHSPLLKAKTRTNI